MIGTRVPVIITTTITRIAGTGDTKAVGGRFDIIAASAARRRGQCGTIAAAPVTGSRAFRLCGVLFAALDFDGGRPAAPGGHSAAGPLSLIEVARAPAIDRGRQLIADWRLMRG
jgi:hypothetical protein